MKQDPEIFTAIHDIQLVFGRPPNVLKELLENLGIYAMLCWIQNKKAVIPNIGELKMRSSGAGLECEFTPSPFLVRNIGQIEKGEEADIEAMLARRFKCVANPENAPTKHAKRKCQK